MIVSIYTSFLPSSWFKFDSLPTQIFFTFLWNENFNLFLKFLVIPWFFTNINDFLQVKRPESSVKTLAVLLPCREKGSKTTKIWLRRLQQYLYYHHKGGRSQSQGKNIYIRLSLVVHPDISIGLEQLGMSGNVYRISLN